MIRRSSPRQKFKFFHPHVSTKCCSHLNKKPFFANLPTARCSLVSSIGWKRGERLFLQVSRFLPAEERSWILSESSAYKSKEMLSEEKRYSGLFSLERDLGHRGKGVRNLRSTALVKGLIESYYTNFSERHSEKIYELMITVRGIFMSGLTTRR